MPTRGEWLQGAAERAVRTPFGRIVEWLDTAEGFVFEDPEVCGVFFMAFFWLNNARGSFLEWVDAAEGFLFEDAEVGARMLFAVMCCCCCVSSGSFRS